MSITWGRCYYYLHLIDEETKAKDFLRGHLANKWGAGTDSRACIFFFKAFIYLFIYLFIYFLVAANRCCGEQASHCGGFSCCGAQALGTQTSAVVAHGLSSCGARA